MKPRRIDRRSFRRDERGGIALFAAVALPAVAVLSLGAIELLNVAKDRGRLQEIADAAALNAAGQMRLAANDQLLARTAAAALADVTGLTAKMDAPDVSFLPGKGGPSGIQLKLTARRMSFFGNLLPPGGFVIRAEARAQQMGTTPLCVLGTSPRRPNVIDLVSGGIIARSCLVQSNKDIRLQAASLIDAASTQAVGSILGDGMAGAMTGAPVLDDPLQSMFTSNNPGQCTHTLEVEVEDGETVLVPPGIHCRHFDIENGTVVFQPGVHHFKNGELQLKKGAKVLGDNVTLVFWKNVKIEYSDGQVPLLDLSGNRGGTGETGRWAGFALAVDPSRGGDFKLNFREIRRLEGVVYVPGSRLVVAGGVESGQVTPWTVIVAQDLRIDGGRRLHINADYSRSAVPVPNGVGNKATGGAPTRLID